VYKVIAIKQDNFNVNPICIPGYALSKKGVFHPETLADVMKKYNIPGIGFARIKGGVVLPNYYGNIDKNTLVNANSNSKIVTSVLFARLAQFGLIDLDKSINTLLSDCGLDFRLRLSAKLNPTQPECHRTLRQILSHCAGISVHGLPGYPKGEVPTTEDLLTGTQKSMIDAIEINLQPYSGNPLQVDAKTKVQYSGGGYLVAEYLLSAMLKQANFQSKLKAALPELCTKKIETFEQLADVLVFKPLGMTKSSFHQSHEDTIQIGDRKFSKAAGCSRDGKVIEYQVWPFSSMAALWTTATDYVKLLFNIAKTLKDEPTSFLTKGMITQLINGVGESDVEMGMAGMGVFSKDGNLQHSGANVGYKSGFHLDSKGDGFVFFTNGENGEVAGEGLFSGIRYLEDPSSISEQLREIDDTPRDLSKLIGTYHISKAEGAKISLKISHSEIEGSLNLCVFEGEQKIDQDSNIIPIISKEERLLFVKNSPPQFTLSFDMSGQDLKIIDGPLSMKKFQKE